MPTKDKFFNTIFAALSVYHFLKQNLHHFSKKKSQSHKIVGIKVFLTIFAR
jgi:hypothetical protein